MDPPVGRSLLLVNQGDMDGDGPRIAGLEKTYTNLIMVPEPFGEFVFGAFGRREQNFNIRAWDDLRDLYPEIADDIIEKSTQQPAAKAPLD